MKADISNHHTENRKEYQTMDAWKTKNDIELTLVEFDKLDYLTNAIFEAATPIESAKTDREKITEALMFYDQRRDIATCASLLMDTISMIKAELQETIDTLKADTEGNASGEKVS